MKQLTFPTPEQEKALEIVENARKELEALGFFIDRHEHNYNISGYRTSIEYDEFHIFLKVSKSYL